jgi:hypothetical protein
MRIETGSNRIEPGHASLLSEAMLDSNDTSNGERHRIVAQVLVRSLLSILACAANPKGMLSTRSIV